MNKYIWLVVLIFVLMGCDPLPSQNQTIDNNHDLFKHLALVETGLDFPGSIEKLETCRVAQDKACLHAYETFNMAKENLSRMPTDEALSMILDYLGEFCANEPPVDAKYICTGTLVALYFFNQGVADKTMRHFLSKLPQVIRENVVTQSVSMNVSWLDNRRDIIVWQSWLESDVEDNMTKMNAIKRLISAQPNSKPVYKVIQEY